MFLFYNTIVLDDFQSFQTGVDAIIEGCTTYGSTPTESSPNAIVEAIKTIYTNRYNSGYNAGKGSSSVSIPIKCTLLEGYDTSKSDYYYLLRIYINGSKVKESKTYVDPGNTVTLEYTYKS